MRHLVTVFIVTILCNQHLRTQISIPSRDHSNSIHFIVSQANGGFIEKYFSGEFAVSMKCVESEEEDVSRFNETFCQLNCFIDKGLRQFRRRRSITAVAAVTRMSPLERLRCDTMACLFRTTAG